MRARTPPALRQKRDPLSGRDRRWNPRGTAPAAFRPERWLDDPQRNPSWIPFGGGMRRCAGAPFAELQLREVLRFAADLTIRPVHPHPEPARRSLLVVVPAHGGQVLVSPLAPPD